MARPQPIDKTGVHDNYGVDTACWGVGGGCMNGIAVGGGVVCVGGGRN